MENVPHQPPSDPSIAELRAQLAAVLDVIADAALGYDACGQVVWLNAAARQRLGAPPADPQAAGWPQFYAPDALQRPLSLAETPASRALRGETLQDTRVVACDAAGKRHTLLASARPVRLGARIEGAVVILRTVAEQQSPESALQLAHDELESRVQARTWELAQVNAALQAEVSERRRAEHQLQQRNQQLATLNALLAAASSSLHLPEALSALRQVLAERLPVAGGAIYTYHEADNLLVLEGHWGLATGILERLRAFPAGILGRPESIDGAVATVAETEEAVSSHTLIGAGPEGCLWVPLLAKDELQGALCLHEPAGVPLAQQLAPFISTLAQQLAVALQNARLFDEVRAASEQLQLLSRRLVDVQEAERRHIARELHDEIGQALTGLQLSLELARRLPPQSAGLSLAEARDRVNELITRVRQLSLDLRPAMLDDLGLLPTLLWHQERYSAQTHIQVEFKHSGLGRRFSTNVETTAYRIVQEALTNVARHAGVQRVAVRVWVDQDTLGVQVVDAGAGFDPEAAIARGTASGLVGMRERVALLGGQLTIESAPGAGTRLTAELPLAMASEARSS